MSAQLLVDQISSLGVELYNLRRKCDNYNYPWWRYNFAGTYLSIISKDILNIIYTLCPSQWIRFMDRNHNINCMLCSKSLYAGSFFVSCLDLIHAHCCNNVYFVEQIYNKVSIGIWQICLIEYIQFPDGQKILVNSFFCTKSTFKCKHDLRFSCDKSSPYLVCNIKLYNHPLWTLIDGYAWRQDNT